MASAGYYKSYVMLLFYFILKYFVYILSFILSLKFNPLFNKHTRLLVYNDDRKKKKEEEGEEEEEKENDNNKYQQKY